MNYDNRYAYDEHEASPYDKTVLAAVFDTADAAKSTLQHLHDEGFHETWMGVTNAATDVEYGRDAYGSAATTTATADASPVVETVEGGGFGASVARFFGERTELPLGEALAKQGVPATDAMAIEHHMQGGGAVITVRVNERYDDAAAILRMSADEVTGTATGVAADRYAADRPGAASGEIADGKTLTLSEERLNIDKQRVAAGAATVEKKIVSENASVDVPVMHEEFFIRRRPVTDRDAPAGSIGDGETIRIPLMREQVVVDKRTVVAEELEIGKRAVTGTQRVDATVRHEELVVDNDGDTLPPR